MIASPGLILLLGALPVAFLPAGWRRNLYMLALPVLALAALLTAPGGLHMTAALGGHELILMRVDPLSRVFGIVFCLAAFLSILYAWRLRDALQQTAGLLYAGAAMAALFAGDFLTLFVFWEGTALFSVLLIWARGTEGAYHSGLRYLAVQITSGLLLLAGALLIHARSGSLAFEQIDPTGAGGLLVLLAFGIKAAFPLLHNWLQDAYPAGTITGTVFLSCFTTKLAIYALARGFPGFEPLIYIGAAMALFPAFYAVIENDLRRVLSYSLNSQLGFMVVGVGIGTPLALNGAAAHAFCSIIYTSLLFMSAGAVMLRTGTAKVSRLGGLYRSMPWTAACCVVAAASISAFPLLSGFVSKSLILSASADGEYWAVWFALLFASAAVFCHSGIKVPYFTFFAQDNGWRVPEAPRTMRLAMGIAAALCIVLGVFPSLLYGLLPFPLDYSAYDAPHVLAQLQLLLFSALAFALLMLSGLYPPEMRAVNLDSDWFYRRLPRLVLPGALVLAERGAARLRAFSGSAGRAGMEGLRRLCAPGGPLTSHPAGVMAIWTAILLTILLLFTYL